MTKLALAILIAALPALSSAAPYIVSDPSDPVGAADKCVYQEEGASAPVVTPTVVVPPATGGSCQIDVAVFSVGTHKLQIWFRSTLWGVDYAKAPFEFTKPNAGSMPPQNLRLVP